MAGAHARGRLTPTERVAAGITPHADGLQKGDASMKERTTQPRSLRSALMVMIGAAILCAAVVVLLLFRGNMLSVLNSAENEHVRELGATVIGALTTAENSIEGAARSNASWDDAHRYLDGTFPAFKAEMLDNDALHIITGFDIAFLHDTADNAVYASVYDIATGIAGTMPTGFTERVSALSGQVLADYAKNPEGTLGASGLLMHDGQAYLICTMPVLGTMENLPPAGTLTLARVLDNAYMKAITRLDTSNFRTEACAPGDMTEERPIRPLDDAEISFTVYFLDASGSPTRLVMTHPRKIFMDGSRLISLTCVVLFVVLIGILSWLFWGIDRAMLKRMEHMSRDVQDIRSDTPLELANYRQYYELHVLGSAINDMARRLEDNRMQAERTESDMAMLMNILDGMDAYLYVSDVDTDEILFINKRMREHFGLGGQVVGKTCWQVLQEGFTERCAFCPNARLHDEPDALIEWEEHNTVTGRDYRNIDRLIQWSHGKRVHMQHSIDITDLKAAHATLEKRVAQQELMANLAQVFIGSDDADTQIAQALSMVGRFLGIGRVLLAELSPERIVYRYEWRDEAGGISALRGASFALGGNERAVAAEFAARRRDHYVMDARAAACFTAHADAGTATSLSFPLYSNGALWGIVVFHQFVPSAPWSSSDIVLGAMIAGLFSGVLDRRAMQANLMRLSNIVESSPQLISLLSPTGEHVYFNPAAAEVTGYAIQDMVGHDLSLLYAPEDVARIQQEVLPGISAHGRLTFDLDLHRRDGSVRNMVFSAFLIDPLAGGGYGSIATDITEMRRLEDDLLAAKEQAEQSSMAKGDFLSRMSHEMRTPMNAIIGMTNIARASDDPDRKEYCLEKIDGASKHLLGVINDILDMSKIEANKFEISCTDFDFERMLMNVVNVVNFRVEEKHQSLMLRVDPALPAVLYGDEQRLAQVMTNLLTNAVKFTPEQGHIGLTTTLSQDDGDTLLLRVEVSDTGIGITPEQKAKLFRSFEQADGGIARKFGGTGLGLAISKRIVELMGGAIWVESVPDEGSTFIFTARLTRSDASLEEVHSEVVRREGLRALAVDDSPETLEEISRIMRRVGVACDTAVSGQRALERLHAAEQPYDIVFVDWRMPHMNGVELTRAIRASGVGNPVIVMISVAEWANIEKEATEAGVTSFLPKPLFPSAVARCINAYFDPQGGAARGGGSPLAQGINLAGRTLLLAEDIDINREIVLAMLEETGVTIDCAENGLEAVRLFAEQPTRFDLILMDIQMPEVDGLEATRRIRAMPLPQARAIPIVAMTANAFREDVEMCIDAGMDSHIAKPIDSSVLMATLERYLVKR